MNDVKDNNSRATLYDNVTVRQLGHLCNGINKMGRFTTHRDYPTAQYFTMKCDSTLFCFIHVDWKLHLQNSTKNKDRIGVILYPQILTIVAFVYLDSYSKLVLIYIKSQGLIQLFLGICAINYPFIFNSG